MTTLRTCVFVGAVGLALGSCAGRGPDQAHLVALGASWAYLADGSDQGTEWIGADFDDSAWTRGLGEFGYGDGDESTPIPSGTDNARFITTYFRKSFNVDDLSPFSGLVGELTYDDGAVVYLNGVEVFRVNLPAGAPTFGTLAVEAAEYEPIGFAVPLERLKVGANVLAVEMHQADTSSSDVSFDLWLAGNLKPLPDTPQ